MIEKTTYHVNKHRFEDSNLKKRKKVYLLRKNIATSRSNKKLDQIKIESFEIVKNIRNINYELKLLDQMKIHLVFHKSLLESTSTKVSILTKLSNDYIMNQKNRYQVQKILKKSENFENERRKYLMKWKDYDKFENTWELRSNLDNCQNVMIAYLKRRQNRFATRNWAFVATSREKKIDRYRQQSWTKKSFFLVLFSCVLFSSTSKDLHSFYRQARRTCSTSSRNSRYRVMRAQRYTRMFEKLDASNALSQNIFYIYIEFELFSMNRSYSTQIFNLYVKLNSYEITIFMFFISLISFFVTQQNSIIVTWFKSIFIVLIHRVVNLLVTSLLLSLS